MTRLFTFYRKCRKNGTNFFLLVFRYCLFRLQGKRILVHQKAIIKGVKNIRTNGLLIVGTTYFGFTHKKDITFLSIKGNLIINGTFSIGRGCRLDIGENATVHLGSGSSINPFTTLIIMHGLKIGDNCAIS